MCQFGYLLAIWIYKWPHDERGEGVQPCSATNPRLPAQDHPMFGKLREFPGSWAASAEHAYCEHAENSRGGWGGGGGGCTVMSLSPIPKAQAHDSPRWISNDYRGGCPHPRPCQRLKLQWHHQAEERKFKWRENWDKRKKEKKIHPSAS